jgi:hypothetical protein
MDLEEEKCMLIHAVLLVSIENCHAAESKTLKRTLIATCNTTYYKIRNCPSNGTKERYSRNSKKQYLVQVQKSVYFPSPYQPPAPSHRMKKTVFAHPRAPAPESKAINLDVRIWIPSAFFAAGFDLHLI